MIASMKRAASTTRYICILLPEDTPPELHAALPVSTDAAHVARLTAADDMPEGNVDGCVWMPGTPASRLTSMLDAHPEISWVHSFSAGVDGIADVIRERLCNSEVGLSNGRGAFSSSLAEYAVAAMLHFNKQLTRCEGNRRKRKWDKFVMPVVAGKTMGLVGFGDIGKATAKLAAALGLRLVALRRHPEKQTAELDAPKLAATYESGNATAEQAFYAQCDYVVCSLPLTSHTRKAVSAASFASMKPSCVFIR